MHEFPFARRVPKILMIHGGPGWPFAEWYAGFSRRYDGLMAVSDDARMVVGESDRQRAVVIPSTVEPERLEVSKRENWMGEKMSSSIIFCAFFL